MYKDNAAHWAPLRALSRLVAVSLLLEFAGSHPIQGNCLLRLFQGRQEYATTRLDEVLRALVERTAIMFNLLSVFNDCKGHWRPQDSEVANYGLLSRCSS